MSTYQTVSYLRMSTDQLAKISLALDAADVSKFQEESSCPKRNAQTNMRGRSYYCEPNTLEFFRSRILSADYLDGGLLFRISESSSTTDRRQQGRNKRATAFDCFGTIVYQSDWCKTRNQSDKMVDRYLETFNVFAHYVVALQELAKYHLRTGEQIGRILVD